MSLTTCTLTGDHGVSTEALGYNTEPFNLQSNKFISFVYPVLSADGSEPELQLGASDQQGVVVASFNGSDYDTKAPRLDKRNLRITTDEQYTKFFEELDARTVAVAKANKASWFPAQKTISDDDIDKLYQPTLRDTAYGKELRCDLLHTGKHAVKFFERGESGAINYAQAPWNDESEFRPLKYEALLVMRYYVVITKRSNGKKYEKIHLKVWPSKVLKLKDVEVNSSGGASVNPTLPVITTMASPDDIRLSEPVRSEKMPHLAFSNVEVRGSELQVNFAPPGEYGETTGCALWPEMGAPGGAPVAADVDVLNGDAGHIRVVDAVERGVMDYIKAHRDTLGAAGRSDDDLDDLFKSCIREAASRTMVRFTLAGGAASALHVVEAGTMRPMEAGEADVTEAECPRRERCIPYGVRFGVTLAYADNGELDGISMKAKARVVALVPETVCDMFLGLGAPDAKRARVE